MKGGFCLPAQREAPNTRLSLLRQAIPPQRFMKIIVAINNQSCILFLTINQRERIMYTCKNYKTKKSLKEDLAAGVQVDTFQPGEMFEAIKNGAVSLEGPHYPQPHTWYATAILKDGIVQSVK